MTINSGIETSKIQGNKKTISSLSLILILAVSMIIVFAQPTFAQIGVPQPEKTAGYITVAPTLVGVGQEATVNIFIYPIPTNYGGREFLDGFRGVTVTFVRPDGTKDTFMPVDGTHAYDPGQTQALGAIYFYYEPNQAGNWSVSFTMPAQNLTDSSGTVQYLGCASNTFYFTVQTDTVLAGLLNGYPWAPLPNPNVFWSYPINTNNREWYQISGDWLGSGATRGPINGVGYNSWQPYGSGPETGHIVWKLPFRQGGLMGGDYGSLAYGAQGSVHNGIVIAGKLFINIPNAGKFECIDLATGEVLYTMDGSVSFGYHGVGNPYIQNTYGFNSTGNVFLYSSYGNEHTPYLIGYSGGAYNFYDPMTGALVRSITGASSVQFTDSSDMAYGVVGTYIIGWNMSKVVGNKFATGIIWNVSVPTSLASTVFPEILTTTSRPSLLAVSSDLSTVLLTARREYWGYNAATGDLVWNLTLNYPNTGNEEFTLQSVDKLITLDPTYARFKCYSILTGALLWESDSFSDSPWATTWTVYWAATNDNENLYTIFPDGTMRAYSLTDGHEVWQSTPFPSTEYPNNAVPMVNCVVMVDGKLYAFAGYTSQYKINPISRFGMLVCIDATNGDTVFTLNGGIRVSSTANGYVVGTGDYDGNLYCIGKGKTSTAVTAQQQVGGSVLIQGSVLDQSAAQPNTPAISDADMSVWMDYLHMQNATLLNDPPACMGVPVTLTAVSSSGNTADLGTVTSDGAGHFAYQWSPTTEGLYTVYATFAGTNSYFSSYAETSATVAIVATPETPSIPTPVDNTALLYGLIVLVVIAILIGIVALLRKR